MDGTDAEAVRYEVTGSPDKKPDLLTPLNSAKEKKKQNPSASNIALISLLFLLFFGVVCAALYLFGFFGSWGEESIDYGLITNLPDENIESLVYITAGEDAFKEASSTIGELLGGGLLKEIKKANIAYAQYSDGASGYAVYLETGQSIPGLADKLGNYLYPSLSLSQSKLGIEKKNTQGIDYYLIKTPGGYSSPFCAWQEGRGIVLLYYSGAKNVECSSLIGKKSSKKAFEDRLKQPESISRVLKTDDLPYAQGWFWQKASDSSILDSLQTEEKTAYGQLFSDKDGIYIFGAGTGLSEKSTRVTGLCEGGSIITSSGKEACYKDSTGSGLSAMSMSSAVSYERGIGEYTIYAFAYPKTQDKESVKKKAEKFIFSAVLQGTEKTWNDHKTLTVTVKEEYANKPVEGAHLIVYKDFDSKVAEASTDSSGKASFKDLPILYFQMKAEKEGFDSDSSYVSATDTNETIYLNSKSAQAASKPHCGNAMCESGENCGNCPADCKCYKGECVNGACRTVPYSIELPSVKNRSWNITYKPLGEKIKVQSDNCFYLDVLSSSGEEIEPYDSDVKKCVSAHGVTYNTTGPGAAPWFNWGGCAGTKYFQADPGTDLVLRVYTEACAGCVCYYPQFNVYDMVDGSWVKYKNESGEKAQEIVPQLNDTESYSISLPHVAGMEWEIPYTSHGSMLMISSDKCFYLNIYDSVGELYPYNADHLLCKDASGVSYDTTEPESLNWFNRDGCPKEKDYIVENGSQLNLKVRTDNSSCISPEFNVYEMIGTRWVKYKNGSGKNDQGIIPQSVDKEQYSISLPYEAGMKWEIPYTVHGTRLRVSSDKCFYLNIYDSVGELYPFLADTMLCKDASGVSYDTSGPESLNWFNKNGCPKTKYYVVENGSQLNLKVRTDNSSCISPEFNVYEMIDTRWVKFLNKTTK